ncbi:putative GEM-like protein 8 [Silene latifolia]|uniref:putative GEM-like protein 8 n=1 Tax=Silene latifolia TaxID=37657 RepID=UPI003D787F1D
MNVIEAFTSRTIPSIAGDDVLRNGLSRFKYDEGSNLQPITLLSVPSGNKNVDRSLTIKHKKVESVLSSMNKLVRRSLSIGANVDKVFRRIFSVSTEEELLRASRCCLSTTAGPIPGRLFISTLKLAFCSDRPISKVVSSTGELLQFHYKIVIPLTKLKGVIRSENTKKPTQKYVQVVTTDEFEFWFMGFLHYNKAFKCLQQVVVSQSLDSLPSIQNVHTFL